MAWVVPIVTTLASAYAGSQQNSQTGSRQVAGESEQGRLGRETVNANLPQLQQLVGAGPGQQVVRDSNTSNQQLASLLQQFSQGGYMPTAQDTAQSQQYAQQAFQPQQLAIQQQFEEEKQRASQLAAQLGRPVNDPIIQAKLSQERMRSQERLGASQSAFASEFAMSQPQQRLGYTAQLANFQSGLASQAMANRQALIGLGSNLQGQDMNFRMGTAGQTQTSGGGTAGAIMGGLAGLGAGLSAYGQLSGAGGGGGNNNTTQGTGSFGGNYTTPSYNPNYNQAMMQPMDSGFGGGVYNQQAAGLRSNIQQFSAPVSPYRGPLSPNQPVYQPSGFGAFGLIGSNNMGPLAPYRPPAPNPYGSTYGITPR